MKPELILFISIGLMQVIILLFINADMIVHTQQPVYWCSENATLMSATGISMFPAGQEKFWSDTVNNSTEFSRGDIVVYNNTHHAIVSVYNSYVLTAGYNSFSMERVNIEDITHRDCVPPAHWLPSGVGQ